MQILSVGFAEELEVCVACDVTMVTAIKSESKAEARACRAAERSAGNSGARTCGNICQTTMSFCDALS